MWFPNRSDTNRPVQAQKRARISKFRIQVEEELYYPSSENKGADQLRSYREADLRLCFRLCRLLVFHEAAQIMQIHEQEEIATDNSFYPWRVVPRQVFTPYCYINFICIFVLSPNQLFL